MDGGTIELKDATATVKKFSVTENGGTLKLASGSTTTFESVTGESGALTVNGADNVTLTFTNGGTLDSLDLGAGVTLSLGNTLVLGGSSTINGTVAGEGGIQLKNDGITITTPGAALAAIAGKLTL